MTPADWLNVCSQFARRKEIECPDTLIELAPNELLRLAPDSAVNAAQLDPGHRLEVIDSLGALQGDIGDLARRFPFTIDRSESFHRSGGDGNMPHRRHVRFSGVELDDRETGVGVLVAPAHSFGRSRQYQALRCGCAVNVVVAERDVFESRIEQVDRDFLRSRLVVRDIGHSRHHTVQEQDVSPAGLHDGDRIVHAERHGAVGDAGDVHAQAFEAARFFLVSSNEIDLGQRQFQHRKCRAAGAKSRRIVITRDDDHRDAGHRDAPRLADECPHRVPGWTRVMEHVSRMDDEIGRFGQDGVDRSLVGALDVNRSLIPIRFGIELRSGPVPEMGVGDVRHLDRGEFDHRERALSRYFWVCVQIEKRLLRINSSLPRASVSIRAMISVICRPLMPLQ